MEHNLSKMYSLFGYLIHAPRPLLFKHIYEDGRGVSHVSECRQFHFNISLCLIANSCWSLLADAHARGSKISHTGFYVYAVVDSLILDKKIGLHDLTKFIFSVE